LIVDALWINGLVDFPFAAKKAQPDGVIIHDKVDGNNEHRKNQYQGQRCNKPFPVIHAC
jgi:hypothetical protein